MDAGAFIKALEELSTTMEAHNACCRRSGWGSVDEVVEATKDKLDAAGSTQVTPEMINNIFNGSRARLPKNGKTHGWCKELLETGEISYTSHIVAKHPVPRGQKRAR